MRFLTSTLCCHRSLTVIGWSDGIHIDLHKRRSFFEFSYVCPEPVLAKYDRFYIEVDKTPFPHPHCRVIAAEPWSPKSVAAAV